MSRISGFLNSNSTNQDTFKHVSAAADFSRTTGSDFLQNQNQVASGLARYRSAPSSFLRTLFDSSNDNCSSGDDESDAFFSALMEGHTPYDLNQKGAVKQEAGVVGKQNGQICGYGYEDAVNGGGGGGAVVGTYSVGMESHVLSSGTNGKRHCSGLARQSSSPAGFGVMREIRNHTVNNHAETSNHASLSNSASNSRFMPSIPENGNVNTGTRTPEPGRLRNGRSATDREFEVAFPRDSWEESPFNGLKRKRDGDMSVFSIGNGLENQNEETQKRTSGLVHHLSLPKSAGKTARGETFLNFQHDAVIPCQIRAKRGFATHPRSIAERMRRNRISEKMKKLQDLFPSMDKQANTAEMLDLAVDHIKELQKQVQVLMETKAKCVCSNNPQ